LDLLDRQVEATVAQLALDMLEGGEQGGLPADQIDQGSRLALVDAQDGQLREQAGAGLATALAGAVAGRVVGGADEEDQAAEQADAAAALLWGAERAFGFAYFFLAASARAGWAAAPARRLATS
jgi:hypothetical protein